MGLDDWAHHSSQDHAALLVLPCCVRAAKGRFPDFDFFHARQIDKTELFYRREAVEPKLDPSSWFLPQSRSFTLATSTAKRFKNSGSFVHREILEDFSPWPCNTTAAPSWGSASRRLWMSSGILSCALPQKFCWHLSSVFSCKTSPIMLCGAFT